MICLTERRQAHGWSRAELGRRARVSGCDVGKFEAGRLIPYPSQLRKLARALGWPVEQADRLMDALPSPQHDPQSGAPSIPVDDGRTPIR